MIKNYNKNLKTNRKMSQIKKCPRCNKRKRRLLIIGESFDVSGIEFDSIYQVLCEECIFLRDLEEEFDFKDKNGFQDYNDFPKITKEDITKVYSDYKTINEKRIGEAIFRKIIPLILKYGFNSDGRMKPEQKMYKSTNYKCKICEIITPSHFEISKHLMNEHIEIPDNKKDENVEEITDFVGMNIPSKPFVLKLEEMTTKNHGISFLKLISKVYESSSLFENSKDIQQTEDLVEKPILIPACWATFLERVYIKFKKHLKEIEKNIEEILKSEQI